MSIVDRIDEKLNESTMHDMDNILDGITYGDLRDAVYSNVPYEKISKQTVMKEWNDMMKTVKKDADFMLRKAVDLIVKELK